MMRSLDASTAVDLQLLAAILADIQQAATPLGIEILVVGAAARDILIRHYVGQEPPRATTDVDIAVAVSSWEDVDALTRPLSGLPKAPQRFLVHGVEVDIVPFGRIESPKRRIVWPNDYEMNVFGLSEALRAAVLVRLPGDIVVPVASLPAQSLLKLLAWRDRRHDHKRDAVDLRIILRAYSEGPYHEALFDNHVDLLEQYDFDLTLAGAARIGGEAGALITPADRRTIADTLLSSDDLLDSLADQMGGGRFIDNRQLIHAYRHGFIG